MRSEDQDIRAVRCALTVFVAGLVLSGLTAVPLVTEVEWVVALLPEAPDSMGSVVTAWILKVRDGLIQTNQQYPFLFYGTDWLAFGHFVIAVLFIGPLKDPIRNRWVVDAGLIACGAVIPFALVAGAVRDIPFFWRLIDCSFGVFGAVPLLVAKRIIFRIEMRGPE